MYALLHGAFLLALAKLSLIEVHSDLFFGPALPVQRLGPAFSARWAKLGTILLVFSYTKMHISFK